MLVPELRFRDRVRRELHSPWGPSHPEYNSGRNSHGIDKSRASTLGSVGGHATALAFSMVILGSAVWGEDGEVFFAKEVDMLLHSVAGFVAAIFDGRGYGSLPHTAFGRAMEWVPPIGFLPPVEMTGGGRNDGVGWEI